MAVKPIPDNYPRVTAYLIVDGANDAIEFYKNVFGFEERGRMTQPDGRVGHAELELDDSVVMLADAFPEMDIRDAKAIGGTPVQLSVYVEDVDKTFAKAIEAGGKELRAVADQFYGDRAGQFLDPWGHRWNVHTHIEDVPPEEMEQRAKAAMGEGD
jgi:PhnB protein